MGGGGGGVHCLGFLILMFPGSRVRELHLPAVQSVVLRNVGSKLVTLRLPFSSMKPFAEGLWALSLEIQHMSGRMSVSL